MVHRKAEGHAQCAGEKAHQSELQRVGAGNSTLAQAQHTQHGAVVQMAGGKRTRGQGHGHGAKQRGQQGHQAQKLLGALQRLAHLGAATLQRLQAHAAQGLRRFRTRLAFGFDLRVGPGHELAHRRLIARHSQPVVQTAGWLHQARGRQIRNVHHHPGGEVHEPGTAVRLDRNHRVDAQLRLPQ